MPVPTPINEFSPFTETHSFNGNVLSMTSTNIPDGMNFTKTSSSFTLSTTGVEVFDRTLVYLDSNDVKHTTTRFSKLPTGYHALLKYIGAAETMLITITVTTDEVDPILLVPPTIYQYDYLVVSNYTIANQMLKQKVKDGLFPAITRNGVDPSAGHCYPARPTDSAGQGSVFVNNILVTVIGAHYPTHCCGIPCHDGVASEGSATVFACGIAVHRIGDDISCGDVSAAGSENVFAG